ncbi:MAG: antitoxin [Trichlorobacter sp.]|nr:antitoxin [Trichlorobacter sp.]
MHSVTIRNVPDEVHRAIRIRASNYGRTIEAEICNMLECAVKPQEQVKLGSLLTKIGKQTRLTDEEVELLHSMHDQCAARAASL